MVQMVNGKPLSKYAAKKAARLEEQQDQPERKFKQVNTRPRPSEFSEVKIHKHGPVQGPVKAKQINVKEIQIVDTPPVRIKVSDLTEEEIRLTMNQQVQQNDASVAASQNKATISETPVTPKENEMSEIAETVKATAAATTDTAAQVMEATRQTIQNTIEEAKRHAGAVRYKADDFFSQDLSDIARQTATMAVKGAVVGAGAYVGWTLGKMAYNAVSDRLNGDTTTA